jgi:hypothetical protein
VTPPKDTSFTEARLVPKTQITLDVDPDTDCKFIEVTVGRTTGAATAGVVAVALGVEVTWEAGCWPAGTPGAGLLRAVTAGVLDFVDEVLGLAGAAAAGSVVDGVFAIAVTEAEEFLNAIDGCPVSKRRVIPVTSPTRITPITNVAPIRLIRFLLHFGSQPYRLHLEWHIITVSSKKFSKIAKENFLYCR